MLREYSIRFLIVMIIGACVMLLFITGKLGQASSNELNRLWEKEDGTTIVYVDCTYDIEKHIG
ncbi:hypothetical protein [Peribacillus asahii]|uniref:hypothetical protein n=1 Tax=Peribacillus asahii TaxID=228899 RepID=UPI002079E006|nr:hypothetical protein [Peribacillus asahii]USK58660.1 hypothetical protein LIT37_15675 [Peribacillus asahii]